MQPHVHQRSRGPKHARQSGSAHHAVRRTVPRQEIEDFLLVPTGMMDVRVGGTRLLCMEVQMPRGAQRMWFTGTYLEVAVNQLLVYTDAMADAQGNVLAPEQLGMPADHPSITEVRVALEPVGGGTRMVLTHVGIPEGSPGAVGWAMALDKLTERLPATSSQ
jgi:uncharacterized protein YndB with AHSA1/START domain